MGGNITCFVNYLIVRDELWVYLVYCAGEAVRHQLCVGQLDLT